MFIMSCCASNCVVYGYSMFIMSCCASNCVVYGYLLSKNCRPTSQRYNNNYTVSLKTTFPLIGAITPPFKVIDRILMENKMFVIVLINWYFLPLLHQHHVISFAFKLLAS